MPMLFTRQCAPGWSVLRFKCIQRRHALSNAVDTRPSDAGAEVLGNLRRSRFLVSSISAAVRVTTSFCSFGELVATVCALRCSQSRSGYIDGCMTQSLRSVDGSPELCVAILPTTQFQRTFRHSPTSAILSSLSGERRFGIVVNAMVRHAHVPTRWQLGGCHRLKSRIHGRMIDLPSNTLRGSPVPESGPPGFVRGAISNERP